MEYLDLISENIIILVIIFGFIFYVIIKKIELYFKHKKLDYIINKNTLTQNIKFPVIAFLKDNSYKTYYNLYEIYEENLSGLDDNEQVDYIIDSDLNKNLVIKSWNNYDIEKNMWAITFEELKQLIINIDSEDIIVTKNFEELFEEI